MLTSTQQQVHVGVYGRCTVRTVLTGLPEESRVQLGEHGLAWAPNEANQCPEWSITWCGVLSIEALFRLKLSALALACRY